MDSVCSFTSHKCKYRCLVFCIKYLGLIYFLLKCHIQLMNVMNNLGKSLTFSPVFFLHIHSYTVCIWRWSLYDQHRQFFDRHNFRTVISMCHVLVKCTTNTTNWYINKTSSSKLAMETLWLSKCRLLRNLASWNRYCFSSWFIKYSPLIPKLGKLETCQDIFYYKWTCANY